MHGHWIRWLYFSRQLRNNHVAQCIGVTSACVRQWMTGKRSPTPDHQRAIARLCGVSRAQYHAGPRMDTSAVTRLAK